MNFDRTLTHLPDFSAAFAFPFNIQRVITGMNVWGVVRVIWLRLNRISHSRILLYTRYKKGEREKSERESVWERVCEKEREREREKQNHVFHAESIHPNVLYYSIEAFYSQRNRYSFCIWPSHMVKRSKKRVDANKWPSRLPEKFITRP